MLVLAVGRARRRRRAEHAFLLYLPRLPRPPGPLLASGSSTSSSWTSSSSRPDSSSGWWPGGLVIGVTISSWLLICTMLLALFLAMSKRRHELVLLEGEAANHRPILKEYKTVPPRSDDLRRHGLDPRRLLPVHDLRGDRGQVRDEEPHPDCPLRPLRHLPLPLPHSPEGRRRLPRAPRSSRTSPCSSTSSSGWPRRS